MIPAAENQIRKMVGTKKEPLSGRLIDDINIYFIDERERHFIANRESALLIRNESNNN